VGVLCLFLLWADSSRESNSYIDAIIPKILGGNALAVLAKVEDR
jgi:hypothetical protein